jgi:TPR repeat protein
MRSGGLFFAAVLAACLHISIAASAEQTPTSVAYERGDDATAIEAITRLAEQGDADAQSRLGRMYNFGDNVPQSFAEAARWYRLAAEQGDAFAQYRLGLFFDTGVGVPEDHVEGMRWFLLAAEQNVDEAKWFLGVNYVYGNGVPQDDVSAFMWFDLLAKAGDGDAKTFLELITRRMTPEQIAEGQKRSAEWKPTTGVE